MTTRRNVAAGLLIGASGIALAACNGTDTSAQIIAIIQKVQAGVVAACAAAGKYVPTAQTVAAVLTALLAAAGKSDLAAATDAIIQTAISDIAAVCPATGLTAAPRATAKGVPVAFY